MVKRKHDKIVSGNEKIGMILSKYFEIDEPNKEETNMLFKTIMTEINCKKNDELQYLEVTVTWFKEFLLVFWVKCYPLHDVHATHFGVNVIEFNGDTEDNKHQLRMFLKGHDSVVFSNGVVDPDSTFLEVCGKAYSEDKCEVCLIDEEHTEFNAILKFVKTKVKYPKFFKKG